MGIIEKPIVKVLMLKGEKGETGAIGTPLVVNSVSGMTDITRNYVNTTNNKWYYHNGTQWVIGGDYTTDLGIKVFDLENNISRANLQELLNIDGIKIFNFAKNGSYTFDDTLYLNADTTLNLNGATITFTSMRGFFNFKLTDTFTGYDGNGNITIRNGNIVGGNISFCHSRNVLIEKINYSNLLKDHFVEINSQSGMTIRNCVFDGDTDATTDYKEFLQIDDMNRDNFPYFTDPNNITYDLTPNENITIENNVFKLTDSTNFVFHTAIGSHTSYKDHPHKNIIIRNNYIDSPTTAGIRLRNVEGGLIENNIIKFNNNNNRAKAIFLTNYNKDIVIRDNRVQNAYQFLVVNYINSSIEYFNDYISVEHNKVEDTGVFVNGREILDMNDCIHSYVRDNTFTNLNGTLFYSNITPELYNSNLDYNCYFENNNCRYVENNENTFNTLCLYGGNWHINDNIFYIPSYLKNTLMKLGGAERSGILYFANNKYTAKRLANIIDFNNYNKTLSNIYGIPFDYVISNQGTRITEQLTYDFTNFNTIRIGLTGQSGTQNTQEYKLYGYNSKNLDARKYVLATPDRNGQNIVITSFELHSDGRFTYYSVDETNGMDLRYIILCNE